ncbi:MAG: DUF4097 family beta strand repeat-containing protein [Spirosomataceae bacterium]
MKNTWKMVFLSSFLPLTLFAQAPYLTKKWDAATGDKLDVMTSGGKIEVVGGSKDEFVVEVHVKGNAVKSNLSQADIQERLDNYEIKVEKVNGTVYCSAKSKVSTLNWQKTLSIGFVVKTPEKVDVQLKTSGGHIHLKNLTGNLQFATSGGALELEKLGGFVKGSTSGGSISLIGGAKTIDLKTSGGSIEVVNVEGDVNLVTSGGSINLKNIKGTANVKTSGGAIRVTQLTGELSAVTSAGGIQLDEISGNVKAKTSAGGINAQMNELGDSLELATSAGSIDIAVPSLENLALELTGQNVKIPTLTGFTGEIKKGYVSGKTGGATKRITAKTTVGTVRLVN